MTRFGFNISGITNLCMLVWLFLHSTIGYAGSLRPNILFIAVDDLNHWVGHLDGHPGTLTPNIDKLASQGMTFSRAYAAAPLCNPSRVSLLTGVMPSRSGVYGNFEKLEKHLPDAITLPKYFGSQGYTVKGAGKIFHNSWNDKATDQSFEEFYNAFKIPKAKFRPKNSEKDLKRKKLTEGEMWAPWGPVDIDDGDMLDAKNADWVITELQNPKTKPFFLAYGTQKPHLNWNVPRKYFNMHPEASIVLPKVIANDLVDVPAFGKKLAAEVLDISNGRDFSTPGGDHNNILQFNQWEAAVRGYLASITFADAQVGRVLDALAESSYSDNTIIVLWGDHGWHLGQKEHWRKHTLWEDGLRTTLVISAPGFTSPNSRSDRVVSLLDIYPTLVDLAGLKPREELDGQSLVPLLKEPKLPWPRAVVSTYGYQNHSVRTERWRYIRYYDGTEELYDHHKDPHEWNNLAAHSVTKNYRFVINRLKKSLPTINALPSNVN